MALFVFLQYTGLLGMESLISMLRYMNISGRTHIPVFGETANGIEDGSGANQYYQKIRSCRT